MVVAPLHSLTDLAAIADHHGSDKASRLDPATTVYPWPAHAYDSLYEFLFPSNREAVRHVFECGIGSTDAAIPDTMGSNGRPGASLRMWREFFPNALVVGADIDPKALFVEPRIATYHVDQRCADSVRRMWAEIPPAQFDLMVDDGLHTPSAAQVLLEGSIDRLAAGGWYVIEDVAIQRVGEYRDWLDAWHCPSWFTLVEGRSWGQIVVRRP